jgi:murein DD-endopeptidase MepM/ murein hydrolase activator NlpD
MSTRASGLSDPSGGLTTSSAIVTVQSQQQTVSAALQQPTLAQQGGSQSSTNLAPGGATPETVATFGLRQAVIGSTPPPTISSSQEGTTDNNGRTANVSASPTPTPTSATPADVPCEASSSPLFCIYTVGPGDTLGTIAEKFNLKGNEDVSSWEILVNSNKPDIVSEDDLLQLGQKLRIPQYSGVVHTVLSSQTLGEIADRYGVTADSIMAVAANGIGDPNALAIGKELIIPNPTRFSTPAPEPTPTATPSSNASGSGSSGSGSGSSGASSPSGGPRGNVGRTSSGFIWPTTGPISSYYGPSHPLGIDIDLFSNPNAPIAAVAAGTVTFAGGDACCSYGYYVVVSHPNGMQTLYAHMSKISVSVGESVSQGEILGLGGRTGYATGNHLHFEVHVGGSIVNPLEYLP